MKKLWYLALIPFVLLFMNILDRFTTNHGVPYWYNTVILLTAYILWLLLIGLPALAAFAFQCFACNSTKSLLLRLIPTATVLAVIVFEFTHPFYGALLYFLSAMLGLTPYFIIPVVLLGLLSGWLLKAK